MQNHISPILIDFIIYGIIVVTIACIAKSYTKDLSDYILGGRSLSGIITALSVGASDMSSWLLMALPGMVYLHGLSMIWNPVALIIGAYLNWKFIAKRLRIFTEVFNDSLTFPAYLCNRFKYAGNGSGKGIRIVTSFAILVFFLFYTASGFVAGAKLTHSTFNINYLPALFISAGVVVLYTTIGGFLAVSWIDFFQGSLMFVSLLVVPAVGFMNINGVGHTLGQIIASKPDFLNVFHDITFLGIVSLFAWGLGYFGQPHINLRFMAIRSVKELPLARRLCMSWMTLSLFGAVLTGLVGFFLYHPIDKGEQDTVFILLSRNLFNPWVTGILLSAILSAIMSNVSAQILMSASILVEDFYRGIFRKHASNKECLWVGRLFLLLMAGIAISIATLPKATIFKLVGFAWSGLGASFGPAMLFSLYWRRMTRAGAIAGVLVGCLGVIAWGYFINIGGRLSCSGILPGFEILPSFILSSIAIIFVSKITKEPEKEILEKFTLAISK